jgi:hypothetical protein
MQSTLTPKQSDDPHDIVVVAPDAVRVAPADQELSSLLQQAARYSADTQGRAASEATAGSTIPPVDTRFRASAVNDVQGAGKPSSMARRVLRAFTALLLATCVGAAAFAWRVYGDTAEKKIAKWATQLVLTVSLPPEKPAPAAQPAPPAVEADAANAASPQPAPSTENAAEAVAPSAAAPSADSAQLLQSMSRDLASLGQQVGELKASIEQLKAGQQQISRDAAKTTEAKTSEAKTSEAKVSEIKASENKASEQNLRPRISLAAPRPPAARPRKPVAPYPPPPQAAAAPALPPVAPYPAGTPYYGPRQTGYDYGPRQTDYGPRQVEPPPATEPPLDPELSSVPRPPMPLR